MKKLYLLCLCLLWLAGCSNMDEGLSDTSQEPIIPTGQEKVDELEETDEPDDQQEKELTEEEAVAIAKKLMGEFTQLMRDMGEKNGWNYENPADYETAKPELLKVATEDFSDQSLKEYVESYYCSCDSVWFAEFNDRTVRIETELREENAFSVKGLVLPNYVSGGYEITLFVTKEEDGWKLDGWDNSYFIGKEMNFTKEEIQIAHPDKEIKEEQYLEQYDVTVYRAESEQEVLGISKKDGELYGIE